MVLSHNTIRGAAGAAVLNAEVLARLGKLDKLGVPRCRRRRMQSRRGGDGLSVARENLVVMKFGGTSVEDAKAMTRTAAIVRGRRERGLEAVVVVSAMAKVTDLLLAAAAAAGRGDKAGALAIAARLRHRHIDTAAELLEESGLTRVAGGAASGVRCAG